MFDHSLPGLIQMIHLIILTFITYYIASGVYNVFFHPLAKFPGPATSAISRLPLIQSHFKGKLHQWFDDVHAKYGSIVRIAPNELSTISPQAWKDIYQSRPFLFKDSYSLTPPLNNAHSLFTAPDGVHHRIRRVFANAFSENALREQSSVIETQVDGFIRRVRREIAYTRGEVDMARFYGYLALDIVGELVYGESFHSLDQEEENNLIRIFALGAKFGSLRTSLSRYHPLELVFGWVGLRLTSKQRTANWKRFQKWTTARLRMGSLGTGRSDFISPVIGNLENEKKMSITRPELDTNSGAIAMAGSSLPTIALTAATYFLLCYPQTLEKLMREIRSNFQAGEEITVLSTQNLPYLKAVITETLRIHHPTPSQLPRLVPNGGRTICGHFIPGGCVIGVPLHTMHTSVENWIEPHAFHPERWLPETCPYYDSRFAQDTKDAYRPFSAGPQNCIGGNVFLAEARMVLSKMVYHFDMETSQLDDGSWPDQRAYLVYEPKPLIIRLRERGP